MAKYAAMRVPPEFKQWLDLRRLNVANALGIEPNKIKYPKLLKMITNSGPIYLDDNMIKKFAPKQKRSMI
jgi:hypothetical protein